MGKDSGNKTQTVTQTSSIPNWIAHSGEDNYGLARQISSAPYVGFSGQRVAGLTPDQLAAFTGVRGLQGSGAAALQPAQDVATRVAGASAPMVSAGNFLSGNLAAYMDPQTDAIEGYALDAIDRQRMQGLNQTGDQALSKGAFGGTRHGVAEGVLNAEAARTAGATSAQLRSDAFTRAASLMTADQDRALKADTLNQAATQTNNQTALDAAKSLGTMAGQQRQLSAQELALLEGIGKTQQGQDQAGLDVGYGNYLDEKAYPIDMLNLRTSILGMSPYAKSSSTTSPVTGQNPFTGALGGLSAGSSIASALNLTGNSGLFATGLGGLLGAMSEDTEKTDVKKVGKDPKTGVGLYAYRYKGDPKTYPKVVGPMASEIEKKAPRAVMRPKGMGGKRVVNLGFSPMKGAFA